MSTTRQALEAPSRVRIGNALGVFFVALSSLMLEITLTRVFSVTLWYHFGPLAVSLAMFGLGASGVFIYVLPGLFRPAALGRQLSIICTLFGISIAACCYVQLQISFNPSLSWSALATLTLLYIVTAIPFFLAGLCISLIFTHLPSQIGRLYFQDLVGAGLGCILAVALMSCFDAPTVVLLAAVAATLGGLCFATTDLNAPLNTIAAVCLAMIVLVLADSKLDWYRLNFGKGKVYTHPEYERWNSYSYVGVWPVRSDSRPSGWGLANTWRGAAPRERTIKIDAGAATVITEFDGDLAKVEHLKHDVTSIGHTLFTDHKVLIIGAGGGRDILAALAFGAKEVFALEYNRTVVEAVSRRFAQFGGGVYDLPQVHKIVAEGRSYVRRSDDTYDLIQLSLVDSWAANATGAYVMAENFLYTKEAFATYFDHLTPDGILSVTRFHVPQAPQLLRVVAIAADVLRDNGIEKPGDHLMVILKGIGGTVLMSKKPFTHIQTRAVANQARRSGFLIGWAPGRVLRSDFSALLNARNPQRLIDSFIFDISAPTDDKPFFFHMAKSARALRQTYEAAETARAKAWNVKWYGTFVLLAVLVIATAMALLCIVLPLFLRRADLVGISGKPASLGYFACLGVGFMLVEIPLIQRFTFFLGHPVFALSVVLFSLLVFAGIGSLLTSRMQARSPRSYLQRLLLVLIALLLAYNFLLPGFMDRFIAVSTMGRVTLAVVAMLPLGILIGMPLPLGMRLFGGPAPRLIPWLWGINGACSVFASLFAIALAMTIGFTWTMLTGTGIYLLALTLSRSKRISEAPLAAPLTAD
ncbi:MAG: hypothetical protein ACE5GE_10110 [Phycisphaerae bacterium]